MKFLIKMGFVFVCFLAIMAYDYKSYDLKTKQEELKVLQSKIYIKPSFIFVSDDHKEFAYVKHKFY